MEGNYFANQDSNLEFINSGCPLLNCVMGGGWPLSRIVNVVGDESTGKTLLAIEAMANFHRQYRKGRMFYREAEEAFEDQYAAVLGMPVAAVDFAEPGTFETIEDFYQDLITCVDVCKKRDEPGFYVVDSLDALTSEAEQKREFGEGSYSLEKPKLLSKLFRQLVGEIARVRMCLMIISQTRDKISVTFGGPKKTRSGGRALDFYASQVLWLSQREKVEETKDGIKRVTGVQIRAQMKKSKIALPYRECDFTIRFGHGIDSLASSLDWLEKVKRFDAVIEGTRRTYENRLKGLSDEDYWAETERVGNEVVRIWKDVEAKFLEHSRPKYRE